MKRALVLGGGGLVGVAWETGLVIGLHEAGVDPCGFDLYVGTSAGAIVGAQLASGALPRSNAPVEPKDAPALSEPPPPAIDPRKLDLPALGTIFSTWTAMQARNTEQAATIGALARDLYRDREPAWIEQIARAVKFETWPVRPFLVTAVDTETGQRRVFDRDSGAALSHAVAASSSVPGLFPAIAIAGGRFMDGQVYSSTHADLAAAAKPDQVLIAMPTNRFTGPGIGAHAERMLELEIELLHGQQVRTSVQTPDAADAGRLGSNLMDPAKIGVAYSLGLERGRAWATELR